MGVPDNSVRDLIQKLRSVVICRRINLDKSSSLSSLCDCAVTDLFDMAETVCERCRECGVKFGELCHKYNCKGCRKSLCSSCVRPSVVAGIDGNEERVIKCCKSCSKASLNHNTEKIYPSESPEGNPDPFSSCYGEKICCGDDDHDDDDDGKMVKIQGDDRVSPKNFEERANELSCNEVPGHLSRITVHRSPVQSDEEEAEDSAGNFFTPSSEYYNDSSDLDVHIADASHESYGFRSARSSPQESLFVINVNPPGDGHPIQQHKERRLLSYADDPFNEQKLAITMMPERRNRDRESAGGCLDELDVFQREDTKFQEPLDLENNGHIWFPPPPEYEDDEVESNYFEYVDDDDASESGPVFSDSGSPFEEKQSAEQTEPLRAVIQGHFRALVLQLLHGEGIIVSKENRTESWLDVVSTLAWQAASFVKPDTSKGGSMDPVDYVKIKCVASGRPSESILVKGIVCTKNIKHKRMTTRCRNPRLLLLGGSLEYQRVSNQLASFNMLLEEEMNHIKVIVSKIEAHRPNVLLVERSVSPCAQEYLLAKEISLVLNVKRPLLERIAQCTGALVTPSVENLPKARIGHCEFFRVEKVCEELEPANHLRRKPSKTLMFFDGCPTRLGCTVLLKGSSREELKRVKHVVQYAVFAAYHLSLQTSFLSDEGATLPKMMERPRHEVDKRKHTENEVQPESDVNMPGLIEGSTTESGEPDSPTKHLDASTSVLMCMDVRPDNVSPNRFLDFSDHVTSVIHESHDDGDTLDDMNGHQHAELLEAAHLEEMRSRERLHDNKVSNEYLSAADNQQSILVSYSSRCVVKGTVCERARLLRIKFYGSFDKPLGRYLHDDLFDQASICRSCKEPVEAHLLCFTHQQGSMTVNVRRLSSRKLPGEKVGKIWMWHRCLRCAFIDGIPPATRRVVMSDAAWGLSFGKFLELSFSNHATANRVASCGHSLQRDCLRFYGCGSMVAFFRYSPVRILSVCLPPSKLEFKDNSKLEWINKEAAQLTSKMEVLFEEIELVLHNMEQKLTSSENGSSSSSDLQKQILELKDLLCKEINDHKSLLHQAVEGTPHPFQRSVGILELNCLRRSLLIGSQVWNSRLYSLDSNLTSSPALGPSSGGSSYIKDIKASSEHTGSPKVQDASIYYPPSPSRAVRSELHVPTEFDLAFGQRFPQVEVPVDADIADDWKSSERTPSPATSFSDSIDSAWTGTNQHHLRVPADSLPLRRLLAPARVHSFDYALELQERLHGGLPPLSTHLSTIKSFHAFGDYRSMIRDPVSSIQRAYYQISPHKAQTLSSLLNSQPSYISSAVHLNDGARLMLPHSSRNNLVIAVYDDEPTSIISCALSSEEHDDWVSDKLSEHEGNHCFKEDFTSPILSSFQSFGSLDTDYVNHGTYVSEAAASRIGLSPEPKKTPHLRVSFGDETSSAGGKVKFSVTCYFANQFEMLRQKCCPSGVEFVCSLSRCRKWSAQGGKSNVYFAKSMDERLIIKQVTKTELDSFLEFGPQYFQYMIHSLSSRSPTCLAKILGIYQVTVKHLSGGKETKMDLLVMENLFFKRSTISKVYDLKGSSRSRYISDPMGKTKVLLDMNLLEALRTNPIFLGSKSKRNLERAVWNDTAFLASVDVMDYSLLVGVDEERKELVLGIIDFMRQYTWDKHLETWVKASGILGGPKNASPTIISPKQYKKRFRKAMTTYFITVPDQWPS